MSGDMRDLPCRNPSTEEERPEAPADPSDLSFVFLPKLSSVSVGATRFAVLPSMNGYGALYVSRPSGVTLSLAITSEKARELAALLLKFADDCEVTP